MTDPWYPDGTPRPETMEDTMQEERFGLAVTLIDRKTGERLEVEPVEARAGEDVQGFADRMGKRVFTFFVNFVETRS